MGTTETMPKEAFLKSLDTLEALAKGADSGDDGAKGDDDNLDDLDEDIDSRIMKGDADDLEDDNDDPDDNDDLDKGFAASAAADSENIQKAVEVSDFLADLVSKVGEAIDGFQKSIDDRFEAIEKSLADVVLTNQDVTIAVADTLRKSFQAVSEKTDQQAEQLQKSLADLDATLSTTPRTQLKSKLNVLEKSFSDGGDASEGKVMSRPAISKALTEMFEAGNPGVTSMDVLRFESNGALSPKIRELLQARG